MKDSEDSNIVNIVISEANPGGSDELRSKLLREVRGTHEVNIVGYARDGLEVVQMASQFKPDLIFVNAEMPGIDGFEACNMAVAASPETVCVMLVSGATPEHTTAAMRAGARAIIDLNQPDLDISRLVEELTALKEAKDSSEYAMATDPDKIPLSIAVTGAKGGSGKTTVATNLASVFVRRFHGEVVLVDFFGQFGNVALSLDLHPTADIGDLMSYQELDVDLVDGHLATHESGLKVLAGTPGGNQEALSQVDIPQIASLVGMLRRKYRFVIFDISPLLWPASPYVFSRCQQIIVVSALDDIATIRDTASLITAIANANIPKERIRLVVNNVTKSNEFTIEDLQEATGLQVCAKIPYEFSVVTTARNVGVPFVNSRPQIPISRVFEDMVDRLLK